MTEPRYGRFDQAEFKRRGNDRTLVLDGQNYRIAELVPQMDGSARWQAWLVDEEEQADRTFVGFSTTAPEVADEIAGLLEEDAPAREEPEAELVPAETPKLADFARRNGWTGHGPISKVIREKYTAAYGVEGGRP